MPEYPLAALHRFVPVALHTLVPAAAPHIPGYWLAVPRTLVLAVAPRTFVLSAAPRTFVLSVALHILVPAAVLHMPGYWFVAPRTLVLSAALRTFVLLAALRTSGRHTLVFLLAVMRIRPLKQSRNQYRILLPHRFSLHNWNNTYMITPFIVNNSLYYASVH